MVSMDQTTNSWGKSTRRVGWCSSEQLCGQASGEGNEATTGHLGSTTSKHLAHEIIVPSRQQDIKWNKGICVLCDWRKKQTRRSDQSCTHELMMGSNAVPSHRGKKSFGESQLASPHKGGQRRSGLLPSLKARALLVAGEGDREGKGMKRGPRTRAS